jgi:succinoglycan biosynthesis transport protein ExoP
MEIENAPSGEPSQEDFIGYLEAPLKRPGLVLTTFFVIFGCAVALTFVLPKKYKSNTLILLESEKVSDAFVTPVSTETQARRLDTIKQIVLSRTFLEQIIKDLKPYPDLAGAPLSVVVDAMRLAIQIRVQGSDSFSIEYVNRSPRKAMEVANRLAAGFIADATSVHERQVKGASEFLHSSLDEARASLKAKEAQLRLLKQSYMGALPQQLPANLGTLQGLRYEKQTLSENLRALDERRDLLANEDRGNAPSVLEKELEKLKAELAADLGRYTEEHPDVRTLRARIAQTEKQLAEAQTEGTSRPALDPQTVSIKRAVGVLEGQANVLKDKMERIDTDIAAVQARIERTPRAEQELADLERDYTHLQEAYDRALKKEMAADDFEKLEKYWGEKTFRIVDPAPLPENPSSPPTGLILLGGLFLAIGGSLTLAVVADLFDRSVRSASELEGIVPFPVLVTIPYATKRRTDKAKAFA